SSASAAAPCARRAPVRPAPDPLTTRNRPPRVRGGKGALRFKTPPSPTMSPIRVEYPSSDSDVNNPGWSLSQNLSEQQKGASEVQESLEHGGRLLVADAEPTEVLNPGDRSLDLPSAPVAAQRPTVLSHVLRPPVRAVL